MTWIKYIPPNHFCILPDTQEAGLGSIWECEHCHRQYKLTNLKSVCGIHIAEDIQHWERIPDKDDPVITIPFIDISWGS